MPGALAGQHPKRVSARTGRGTADVDPPPPSLPRAARSWRAHCCHCFPALPCHCSALAEARIPPGPRLLILHHLDQYRNPSAILKPAIPLPMPPPRPAVQQAGASR